MQTTQHVLQNAQCQSTNRLTLEEVGNYSCKVCGGERYHLVLTAKALKNSVGLKIRCGNCNAAQDVIA